MITVHHLERSRSHRVLWLLEELEVPYQIKRYQREASMLAPEALKKVHPLGKSPVITDGDLVVAESGAIAEYLVERHGEGRLRPAAGTPARLRYTHFLHYAEGSAMPPLLLKLVFDKIEHSPLPFFVKPIARGIAQKVKGSFVLPQIALHLNYLEGELAQRPWFTGEEFTAADIALSFPLEAAATRGGLDAKYPNLSDFLKRIHARPAYQRALERGGKYEIGKA